MWSLEGGVLASALRASMPSSKSYSSQRRVEKKKKKKKCYSYSYNDPILTAMCCVHKIFYFFPEAKWPFVNTLVNVQWSKWIFKQVLYQIPAMMTLQGAVSALHQYTEWCVPRVGGKEKRKKQQLVIYRFIHHWGKRCTGGMFCSWMVSSFEFFPPPPPKCYKFTFFFQVITVVHNCLAFIRMFKGRGLGGKWGLCAWIPPLPD